MDYAKGLIHLGFMPEIDFETQDDGNGPYIKDWKSSSTKPTDAEIEAVVVAYDAAYDAAEYQRNRAAAYPSIQEQLDMQYWDSVNGTTTWADAIAAVKAAHPKGA
jgi:hypothetical protein